VKRFRRHRSREPFFWTRAAFSFNYFWNDLTGSAIGNSIIGGADGLATGGIVNTGIDQRYTSKRIRLALSMSGTTTSFSGFHQGHCLMIVVKCSTSAITAVVGSTVTDVLSGGSSNIPAALDVLDVKAFPVLFSSNIVGNPMFTQFFTPADFDIKVSRRLEADESIFLLSSQYMDTGDSLPAGATASLNVHIIASTLYSRTLRRT